VTCAGCGKLLEVDEGHAGKRGKCKHCGQLMTIPGKGRASPPPPEEPDVYRMDPIPEPVPSTFVPAPSRSRATRTSVHSDDRAPRRAIPIGLVVAALVLLALVALVPEVMMGVGMVLAISGILLALYGFFSGASIAFSEDWIHGVLYLSI